MRVLLTGATGFTGSHVLSSLRDRGVSIRCLVRNPEKAKSDAWRGVDCVVGDLSNGEELRRAMAGCDLLINVASIGFGHAAGIIQAAEASGVRRAVFVSTTAIFTQLNAPSKAVRVAAEDSIRDSRLRWTILRPTMIYGTDRDRNICRLIRYVRRYPILPVFGSGEYLLQPVYVCDLAEAIVSAAMTPAAEKKEYTLSGEAALSYNELVRTVARSLGRRIFLWHLPHMALVKLLGRLERSRLRLPIKAEQILRLNEHKAFSWEVAGLDFGFAPRSFAAGVEAEIRSMGYSVRIDSP
jgi:uncharacterized protein YbjT (DUF2867 family)